MNTVFEDNGREECIFFLSLKNMQQMISTILIYSQTCLKGSPKGRTKSGCLRQVTP